MQTLHGRFAALKPPNVSDMSTHQKFSQLKNPPNELHSFKKAKDLTVGVEGCNPSCRFHSHTQQAEGDSNLHTCTAVFLL